jgi:endonuclease/exonuclease/phosphatase (EEP) superfamily protein YafD
MLIRQAWLVTVLIYILFAFSAVFPQNLRNASSVYVVTAWLAFMIQIMRFHIGLLLTVIAAGAVWARNRKLLLVVAPAMLFALWPALYSYRPRVRSVPSDEEYIRVMSVNLLALNHDAGPIVDEIRSVGPDLLLIQEYTSNWHRALETAFSEKYPYRCTSVREDCFGLAIYSSVPFVGRPAGNLLLGSGNEPQMRAEIDFAGRRLAVYNFHPLPPRRLDYIVEHRLQLADLLERLADEPLPVLLCGDFNFTPDCFKGLALRRVGLREVNDIAGWGRGATWPVNSFFRYLPGVRFDGIWLGPQLTAKTCRTGLGLGSDHRPVMADIAWITRN